jgi:hypothetical protein
MGATYRELRGKEVVLMKRSASRWFSRWLPWCCSSLHSREDIIVIDGIGLLF